MGLAILTVNGIVYDGNTSYESNRIYFKYSGSLKLIDWGDGDTDSFYTTYHSYSEPGTYTISIKGDITSLSLWDTATFLPYARGNLNIGST